MWGKMEKKVAVVTGASSGIGAELCKKLGSQNWSVVLAARRLEELNKIGGNIIDSLFNMIALNEKIFLIFEKKIQSILTHVNEFDVTVESIQKSLHQFIEESLSEYDNLKIFKTNSTPFDRRNLASDMEKIILENANIINNDNRLYISAFSFANKSKDHSKKPRRNSSYFNLKKN